jgi:hypothetical protein
MSKEDDEPCDATVVVRDLVTGRLLPLICSLQMGHAGRHHRKNHMFAASWNEQVSALTFDRGDYEFVDEDGDPDDVSGAGIMRHDGDVRLQVGDGWGRGDEWE